MSEQRLPSPLRDPDFRSVLVVVFVVMLGFGIVAPVLPLYARSFDVSRSAVGLLISGFSLVRLLSQTPGGLLVDRYGERPVAVVGVWIVGLSSLAAAFAPNYWVLLAARGVGGVGSAWFISSMYSYVLSIVDRQRAGRALALYQGAFTLGISMGPALGGFVGAALGLRAPFVIYAGACTLSGAIAIVRLKPRKPRRQEAELEKESFGLRVLVREPGFVLAVIGNVAVWVLLSGTNITLLPLFGVEVLGQSAAWVGGIITAASLASLVFLPVAGRLTDRAETATLTFGMLASAVVVIAIGYSGSSTAVVVLAVLFGVASGTARVPVSTLLSSIPTQKRGRAVAIQQMAGDAGGIVGPVLAGGISDAVGYGPAFVFTAFPAAAVALVSVRFWRRASQSA